MSNALTRFRSAGVSLALTAEGPAVFCKSTLKAAGETPALRFFAVDLVEALELGAAGFSFDSKFKWSDNRI